MFGAGNAPGAHVSPGASRFRVPGPFTKLVLCRCDARLEAIHTSATVADGRR